jgi:large subunit ribosomal protein L5
VSLKSYKCLQVTDCIPSYPPKMIPGCHITIQTDATSNKDARLLLQAIGLPFHGKLND